MILCFILKIILYPTLKSWRITDWQCYANFFCRAKWLSYAYIDFLFYFLFHYCLPLDIEYISLCYTVTQEIFNSQFCFFKKPNSSRLTTYKSSSVHNHNSLKFNHRRAVKRWGMLMKSELLRSSLFGLWRAVLPKLEIAFLWGIRRTSQNPRV